MYNATSEILCVLPSKKNERKPKFSFKRGLLAIAAARQCGLGLLSLFFFPDAIALCIAVCVSNLLKEREKKKKDFGTPPKVLIPFCSIGYLKFDFWLLLLL